MNNADADLYIISPTGERIVLERKWRYYVVSVLLFCPVITLWLLFGQKTNINSIILQPLATCVKPWFLAQIGTNVYCNFGQLFISLLTTSCPQNDQTAEYIVIKIYCIKQPPIYCQISSLWTVSFCLKSQGYIKIRRTRRHAEPYKIISESSLTISLYRESLYW